MRRKPASKKKSRLVTFAVNGAELRKIDEAVKKSGAASRSAYLLALVERDSQPRGPTAAEQVAAERDGYRKLATEASKSWRELMEIVKSYERIVADLNRADEMERKTDAEMSDRLRRRLVEAIELSERQSAEIKALLLHASLPTDIAPDEKTEPEGKARYGKREKPGQRA